MDGNKILCDAVFGFITLKPHIIVIMDTPEFQRLRSIAQLGVVTFIYPTAHHNRFEHSIGTYWLASNLVTQIKDQLDREGADKRITSQDVMCVEIAALCHDIGHGPFSHFWDKTLLPAFFGQNFKKHEKQFGEMWEIIKQNKRVKEMIETNKLDEKLINDLINGEGDEILCDIVNNDESGMDVDKWDYLARDSMYLGHSSTNYRVDIERMIHFARANQDKVDNKWTIAFRDSEGLNIFRVFHLRHYLYQTAYLHRTANAINQMLLDGIRQCISEKILSIDDLGKSSWIIKNNDAIFWSNCNNIKLFERILKRDLYKTIFEARKNEIDLKITKETILNECLGLDNSVVTFLRFVIDEFKLGNKSGNPMLKIPFYSKTNYKEVFKYGRDNGRPLPSNLNMDCNETRIIVFSTFSREDDNSNYDDAIQSIKEKLEKYCLENGWEVKRRN